MIRPDAQPAIQTISGQAPFAMCVQPLMRTASHASPMEHVQAVVPASSLLSLEHHVPQVQPTARPSMLAMELFATLAILDTGGTELTVHSAQLSLDVLLALVLESARHVPLPRFLRLEG